MKTPFWLRSLHHRVTGRLSHMPLHRARRLTVESLEARDVPSVSINISDATIKEQGNLGTFVPGNTAVLKGPSGLAFGPDRSGDGIADLYALGRLSNNVVVYNGTTGAFIEELVPPGNGLDGSAFLTVGPDGDLYTRGRTTVGDPSTNCLLRIDHTTGAVSVFVPYGSGGFTGGSGTTFGPDGNFYVSHGGPMEVLRYDADGRFLDTFVAPGSGGLANPGGIRFGPDRTGDSKPELYVASSGTDQVLVFDGVSGSPLGSFVAAGSGGLDAPWEMQFGPDGHLYVVSSATSYDQVLRFDGVSGAFIDIPVARGSGLTPETPFIALDRVGDLYVCGEDACNVLRYSAGPLVTLSEASTVPVTVDFSTADGTANPGGDYGAVSGRLTFAPGETSKRILVTAVDDGVGEPSETFAVNLSNAVGAPIASGQGTVTILNSQTKFFVVDDGTTGSTSLYHADKTYKYESGGASIVSNVLAYGSTAPRGIASNATGTRLWVVDANKTVYVYDNRNVLLGSWTAGSLNAQAQVEGIAVWGSDVWILDAKQDRVFKYIGAATLLTGSQNAASSFSLNSGNKNPKDLVTDGSSIWLVDDAATDKVFKYTLTGSFLGSWTLNVGSGSPTGITLDPSNAQQHLWVVDNATDRVYQYDNARSRTSGSQSASTTFALAAGNINPQGIADPPVISIDDSTAIEGGAALRSIDRFVAEGSGGIVNVAGSVFGPDGNQDGASDLYVAGYLSDAIFRYDGQTGWPIDTFVPQGSGGLDQPIDLAFGPDGNLYVTSSLTNQVLRYHGSTGAFLGVAASGLANPQGLTFGGDGSLYIANRDSHEILRYQSGNLSAFVGAQSGGLLQPRESQFGPDGNGDGIQDLYVASGGGGGVLRYHGLTGAFIDVFASSPAGMPGSFPNRGPYWLHFGGDGYLYTSARTMAAGIETSIVRFNAATSAFVDKYDLGRDGWNFIIGADNLVYSSSDATGNFVERFGHALLAAFMVRLDAPSTTPVTIQFTTAPGTAVAGSDYTATAGTLTFAPGQTSRTILVRTVDDSLAEPTETFTVTLSNPVGATIARGQGVGTITDNDPPAVRVASVAVNGGAAQRSRVTQVAVNFSGQVAFAGPVASAFRLSRVGGGSVGGFSATASTVGGVTVVTLANLTGAETEFGSLVDGRYALTIVANQITTPGGFDGNGDGTAGDDYVLNGTSINGLYRYYGDTDGNGVVDGLDFFALRSTFNLNSTQAGYLSYLDVNGDNIVDGLDFFQFRSRFNTTVP